MAGNINCDPKPTKPIVKHRPVRYGETRQDPPRRHMMKA
jgi:hypothetical protein